ncbi:MAG: type III-B CRISPR module-associated protein Cmr3, partial [Bryobacteraceae bacterium]
MNGVDYLFLEPVDVLFFRANKGFGDPGSYGESMVPPWPSVVAGALRSRILADSGTDLAEFAKGHAVHREIGTCTMPGSFVLTCLQLARRREDKVEALYPAPADLIVEKEGIRMARPVSLPEALRSSYPLPLHPVVAQKKRGKPEGGQWLTEQGWRTYLDGGIPGREDLVSGSDLWQRDARVGIGLNAHTRSVEEGRLFTAEAAAFRLRIHASDSYDAGLLVGVSGCTAPRGGLVRLGADGRAAAVRPADGFAPAEPDWARIVSERRCRLILATPGLFSRGWLPEGCREQNGQFLFDLQGVRARLVAAAAARAETVSGWDLAREAPKPAQRAVPAGSVYWLDDLEADEEA